MAEFERSETVAADADELFAFLSDVRNAPEWVRRMSAAEPTGDGTVRVAADFGTGGTEPHHHVPMDAWFTVEPESRRLAWGSDDQEYRGEVQVQGGGAGTSSVTVRVHTRHADGVDVDTDLTDTVRNIRRIVEGLPPAP